MLIKCVKYKIIRKVVFDCGGADRARNSERADSFTEMCCDNTFDDFDFQINKLIDEQKY
jgi:hypothetical protein